MNHSRWTVPFMAALASLSIVMCGGDDDEDDFVYPLTVGNSWDYSRQWAAYFYSDSTGTPQYEDSITYSSEVLVTIPRVVTLLDTLETHEMVHEETEGTETFTSMIYYRNEADGLYSYAYHVAGQVVAPRARCEGGICLHGMWFQNYRELSTYVQGLVPSYSASSDSIIFEDPPVKSLEYPLRVGAQWTYRQAGNPWRMDKKVLGKSNIEVQAGGFSCFVIRWLYDFDSDEEWDEDIWIEDYVCTIGVVARRISITGGETRDEYGNPTGFVDTIDEYELLSHEVDRAGAAGLPLEPPATPPR